MMTSRMTQGMPSNDSDLVNASLTGNRDAFGQIVSRYQSLICSLAYSATGSLTASEDLAQETFVTAWKQLRNLREPEKLRAWLCGIARNLINNFLRREGHEPSHGAEPLDKVSQSSAPEPLPAEQVISKEEVAILWRALQQIPETYREPLVLFYREHQSIETVAKNLDLTEDTVKQRLSRGRKLLQQEVLAFVEGALGQSAPGSAFTASVLSALPGLTVASAASMLSGTVAKGGATGKAAIASGGFLSSLLWPILCLIGAVVSIWGMAVKVPDSRRERRFTIKAWAFYIAIWLGYFCATFAFGNYADWHTHAQRNTVILLGSVFGFGALTLLFWKAITRAQLRIRKEEGEKGTSHGYFAKFKCYEYRSSRTLLGLPLVHVRMNRDFSGPPAKGWIAVGTKAYGLLFAAGGIAVAPISWGATAIGIFAWGGFGLGLLAFGGMALGIASFGGGAIGYLAYGGGAIGWLGASGGVAWAHHFAIGGASIAQHANDEAAQAFMQQSVFFRYAQPFTGIMILLSWMAPIVHVWFKKWLDRKAGT